MKEGKFIIGQLGSLLKSRMEGEDHDHHHHHSTEKDIIELESSMDSREIVALSTNKKHSHEPPIDFG